MRSRLAISAAILAGATVWAGCGSKSHALTIDDVRSCLLDAGFLIGGEGKPGAGQALAVRTPEKRGYAYADVAVFETEHDATMWETRFRKTLERPPRNPDATYLETLLQRRGKVVYGWTTRPAPADIRTLESCAQPR